MIFVLARVLQLERFSFLYFSLSFLCPAIAHEAMMLREIKTALRYESEVAHETWVLNVLVESQIPTVALFLLLATQWFSPYQVLVAPAVLLYFLLIILSTLRLSPTLTLLTGFTVGTGLSFHNFLHGNKVSKL